MSLNDVSAASMAAKILYMLARIPSPSGRESEAVNVFIDTARGLGLDAWTDEAGNAYAAPPQANRRALVLLASHIDTVEGWIEPGTDGEKVWGRGVVDAKGPLTSMLVAVAEIARANPAAPVAVAALVGEEADSPGARFLVETRAVPPYVIIGEPTGLTGVAVGYRGSARLVVECYGRGGHSASPWNGDSALTKLLSLLARLEEKLGGRRWEEPSFAVTGLWAGRGDNVLPTKAKAVVDVRLPPSFGMDKLKGILNGIQALQCRVSVVSYTPAVRVNVSSPVPRALVRAILSQGLKPRIVLKHGTSDMNLLAPHAASIAAYGPGNPAMAHTDYEEVTIKELAVAISVYEHAVAELLENGGKGSKNVMWVRLPE